MNDIEYTRWARRIGHMRAENAEAVMREARQKQEAAREFVNRCPLCNKRRTCEKCRAMWQQLLDNEELHWLAETRLDNINHSKLAHAFGAKHGRWPNDDDELYGWYESLFAQKPNHSQEERDAFNTLLGYIEIDL